MLRKHENQWAKKTLEEKKEIYNFSNDYKLFLNSSKTEREFIKEATKIAEGNGFKSIENYETLKIGDKVYYTNRGKNIILAVVGKDKIESGANIIVSHADVPRLDLKGNPLYEDIELAMMKTHYYGGIKKYQWVSIPLALHGVVILEDGTKVDIIIGEDENDPVFTIPDILPHLARKVQGERKAGEVIKGEELNVLIGSIPSTIEDKEIKEKVKYAVLEKLNEKYGMVEEDFISAELQIVPAFKAKDVGLDRAIVGAYGHDDRVCGFTSLKAIIDLDEVPNRTSICYIVDKEEIGSTGSTGLESNYIEFVLSDMINRIKGEYSEIDLKKCLWNSKAISADVSDALNPMFKEVHDSLNVAKLGQGIVVTKYTGSGGKYSTNDADAEFVFEIRKLFNERKISWQIGMLGKVDEGGGGTVAKYLAHFGIKTIDAGPALLAMHSPFELASKLDIYETYKAYKSFFKYI